MSQKIKVSVLIPVWNQEKLIVRALESIPQRDDIEILICDDASTDETAAAVTRYMEEHPDRRIRFCRQPVNRGEGATRNVLFDMASGEYIASLDSDDQYAPEEFEKAMDQLDGTDIVFITWKTNSGHVPVIDQSNKLFYCGLSLRLIRREFLGDDRCEPIRYAPDKTLSVKLDAREHTEKFTQICAYLYNYPRAGSLVDLKIRGYESMYNTILYYGNVCKIGGVETFFYEMARKYGDRDLTLLYKTGDPEQLHRLSQYIRVKRWDGKPISCRQAIFGYSFEPRDLDLIQAEEYIQVIHADFLVLKNVIRPKVDKRFRYIAVSENNAVTYEQVCGIRPEVCYNPITLDKPRKVLHLISATRLGFEKGLGRMQQLAKALDDAGVRYVWTIYTDTAGRPIDSPNVIYAGTRLDIRDYIADADYLVQLSDTEGYPYSLLEALSLGTPVIVTDLPSNPDSQVVDGVNAIVLPFDMSEIPVDRIAKGLKRFKYKPREDGWGDILLPSVSTWEEERGSSVTVEAVQRYLDIELDKIFNQGETHECSRARGEDLEHKGLARILY